MKSWNELTKLEQLQSEFSDFHKEVHGFRPHWPTSAQWSSESWLNLQMERLVVECEVINALETKTLQESISRIETQIESMIRIGANDRDTAIRWLAESFDDDVNCLCYEMNLPYGYLESRALCVN